jgi:hypothetical protein
MLRSPLAAAVVATIAVSSAPGADPAGPPSSPEATTSPDPARQFDYWCGTWSIDNDRILPNGTKQSGPATLTVRPILDGAAILEQGWEGSPDGELKDVFGMSLRWYDPALERWVVILCWPAGPTPGARFARMEGGFTETETGPEGVLYPPECFKGPGLEHTDDFRSRFIFSEATHDSLRWSLEVPYQGQILRVWDMHFTRTADAVDANAPLEINTPPEECACTQPGARDLDWLVGHWNAPEGVSLHASSATRGCTTFLSLERAGSQESFVVLALSPDDQAWHAQTLDKDRRHAAWHGSWNPDTSSLALTLDAASDPDRIGETGTLTRTGDDEFTLTIQPAGADAPPASTTTFRRAEP